MSEQIDQHAPAAEAARSAADAAAEDTGVAQEEWAAVSRNANQAQCQRRVREAVQADAAALTADSRRGVGVLAFEPLTLTLPRGLLAFEPIGLVEGLFRSLDCGGLLGQGLVVRPHLRQERAAQPSRFEFLAQRRDFGAAVQQLPAQLVVVPRARGEVVPR
ncbi:hypothetical protein, partial [Nocardia sp. CY41]|uniref:hypothetical protein n=1 Tax=Nocardia sp. CY41 TaxID=2608686 RepID=UPI001359FDE0